MLQHKCCKNGSSVLLLDMCIEVSNNLYAVFATYLLT